MGGSNLSLEANPSRGAVERGTETALDVQLKIVTTSLQGDRPPLNLFIILDNSGSMASAGRLTNAKLAITNVINRLSRRDMLHLITYNNTATVVFEKGDLSQPQFLLQAVNAVQAGGGTNMEAGLRLALEVYLRQAAVDSEGPTPRFFMFSDGQVNSGFKEAELLPFVTELYDTHDIKLSSFGVGKSFNESLMEGMAEHGMGTFFFIEGAQSMDKFVQVALEGVANCVATDALLDVKSPHLKELYGYEPGQIKLGDLTENNTRQIIASLNIPPCNDASVFVLSWQLTFRAAGQETTSTLEGTLEIPTVEVGGELLVDEAVECAAIIARAAGFDKTALGHMKSGNNAAALAVQQEQIELLTRYEQKDRSGAVKSLLQQAKDTHATLSRGDRESANKKWTHQAYQKRRGSYGYITGYGDDSE